MGTLDIEKVICVVFIVYLPVPIVPRVVENKTSETDVKCHLW